MFSATVLLKSKRDCEVQTKLLCFGYGLAEVQTRRFHRHQSEILGVWRCRGPTQASSYCRGADLQALYS